MKPGRVWLRTDTGWWTRENATFDPSSSTSRFPSGNGAVDILTGVFCFVKLSRRKLHDNMLLCTCQQCVASRYSIQCRLFLLDTKNRFPSSLSSILLNGLLFSRVHDMKPLVSWSVVGWQSNKPLFCQRISRSLNLCGTTCCATNPHQIEVMEFGLYRVRLLVNKLQQTRSLFGAREFLVGKWTNLWQLSPGSPLLRVWVAVSTPGRSLSGNHSRQIVHAHLTLSPSTGNGQRR